MTALAVDCQKLSVRYGSVQAVDELSFSFAPGELFGLLGPNGAGKSSVLSVLCTLRKPSAGEVRVAGYDVQKEARAVRKHIGVIFQDVTLDDRLSGRENLELHARIWGIDPAHRRARLQEAIELCDLASAIDRQTRTYSGGMKRRLELARVLVHQPRILFLDEPTAGLDAQTRRHLWQHLQTLRQEHGLSVLLTTHYLEEAEQADRVAIIDRGRLIALGSPDEIAAQVPPATTPPPPRGRLEEAYVHLVGRDLREEEAGTRDRLRDALQRKGRGGKLR